MYREKERRGGREEAAYNLNFFSQYPYVIGMFISTVLWMEKLMPEKMHRLLRESVKNGQGGELNPAVWVIICL